MFVFLTHFYFFVLFPDQFVWVLYLELPLGKSYSFNCLTCGFVLSHSWHSRNWHSNIHSRDVGILQLHEIIVSTIDRPKLLSQVRLRAPSGYCSFHFNSRYKWLSILVLGLNFCSHCCFVVVCLAVWSWTEHSWSSCFLNKWWLFFAYICCWWLAHRGKLWPLFCSVRACHRHLFLEHVLLKLMAEYIIPSYGQIRDFEL